VSVTECCGISQSDQKQLIGFNRGQMCPCTCVCICGSLSVHFSESELSSRPVSKLYNFSCRVQISVFVCHRLAQNE